MSSSKPIGFLSRKLAEELSPEGLREKYFGMFRGYTDETPTRIHLDEEFCGEEWPGKEPGDVGWAYVGLSPGGYSSEPQPVLAIDSVPSSVGSTLPRS